MKTKHFFLMSLLVIGTGVTTVSCGNDDPAGTENNNGGGGSNSDNGSNGSGDITTEQAQNYNYTAEESKAWGNYAANVALLLNNDAETLYNEWNTSFAANFKAGKGDYKSTSECIQQIIDGCVDIANEVGTSKIGDPYNKYKSGKTTEALYAVESWYSYHSRDDYKNNILSIANSLAGKRFAADNFTNVNPATDAAENSIYRVAIGKAALKDKMEAVWNNTVAAWKAIDAIPDPFRNNIGDAKVSVAMDACEALSNSLENIKVILNENLSTDEATKIVATYVDDVVMPTYKDLKEENAKLYKAVLAFQQNPTQATCNAACEQWLAARAPWETSEAFLFGPVAKKGLDPNMDSWPLDAVAIVNLLKSQKWSEMEWDGEFVENEDGEPENPKATAIEAAQAVRGFHTLEFLLFQNGNPRTIK